MSSEIRRVGAVCKNWETGNLFIKTVCTKETVQNASFSASIVIPYNPDKINLNAIPSKFSRDLEVGSPIQVTCSPCTAQDVELHQRVKSGIIPKYLSQVLPTNTRPLVKPKCHLEIVTKAQLVNLSHLNFS